MDNDKKLWGLLVHLTMDSESALADGLPFDEGMWDWTLENAVKAGYNTIVLSVGNGIEFGSHPEIAAKTAWSRKRVREEIAKAGAMGLALIPEFNFSACHCDWLGKYARMISTEEYYHVCNDLIREIYEIFEHPAYIHLGMDEEDDEHARGNRRGLGIFRHGDLYWHDLRFLLDCVEATGATPWIWYDPTVVSYERYMKTVDPSRIVLSPWYYDALKEENFVPFSEYPWDKTPYNGLDLQYIEDIPKLKEFRECIIPRMADGHRYIPCSWSYMKGNTAELAEYFKKDAPYDQILGHLVAVWCATKWENKARFEAAFREFGEVKPKLLA